MKKVILLTAIFFYCLKFTLAQPVRLDSSFGINGIVKTDLGGPLSCDNYTTGNQVLVQSDGSMFVIAEANGQTMITKRLSNGSVDLSYGNDGFSMPADISGSNAILQRDGKILVAGSAIARYNTNGSLDNTFSVDGIQTTIRHHK